MQTEMADRAAAPNAWTSAKVPLNDARLGEWSARADPAVVQQHETMIGDDGHWDDTWLYHGRPGGKEGLLHVMCVFLSVWASVPLYFLTLMALSIMYGQYRDPLCPDLNAEAWVQVVSWGAVMACIVLTWLCWYVWADNPGRVPSGEWSYALSQPLLYLAVLWLFGWSGYAAKLHHENSDPDGCRRSGLWSVSMAAIVAGFWLAVLGTCQALLVIGYGCLPEIRNRPEANPELRAEAAVSERINTALRRAGSGDTPTTVLVTGMPGWGHHSFALNFIAQSARPDCPVQLATDEFGYVGAATPRLTEPRGRRNEVDADAVLFAAVPLVALPPNHSARDFAAKATDTGAGAGAGAARHSAPVAVHAVATTHKAHDRVGGDQVVRIDVKAPEPVAGAALRWQLSHDTLGIVHRFAGPAALSAVTRVCRGWRAASPWQKLVPLWWADATGERLAASALTGQDMQPQHLLRVLSRFDRRDIGAHRYRFVLKADASQSSARKVQGKAARNGALQTAVLELVSMDELDSARVRTLRPDADLRVVVCALPQLLTDPDAPDVRPFPGTASLERAFAPTREAAARRSPAIVWFTHSADFCAALDEPLTARGSGGGGSSRGAGAALLSTATRAARFWFEKRFPAFVTALQGDTTGGHDSASDRALVRRVTDAPSYGRKALVWLRYYVRDLARTSEATSVWVSDGSVTAAGAAGPAAAGSSSAAVAARSSAADAKARHDDSVDAFVTEYGQNSPIPYVQPNASMAARVAVICDFALRNVRQPEGLL